MEYKQTQIYNKAATSCRKRINRNACLVHRRHHCRLTSSKALLNSPPGAIPSCSVILAERLSNRVCITPLTTPFCIKKTSLYSYNLNNYILYITGSSRHKSCGSKISKFYSTYMTSPFKIIITKSALSSKATHLLYCQ